MSTTKALTKNRKEIDITDAKKYNHPEYYCIDCGGILIPKQGDKNTWHFAHSSKTPCGYDSLLHETAKKNICDFVNSGGGLEVELTCSRCNGVMGDNDIPTTHDCKAIPEYSFKMENGTKRADIGIVDENKNLSCIVEIFDTHRTDEKNRPENIPWYEVNAKNFLCDIYETLFSERLEKVSYTDIEKIQKTKIEKLPVLKCVRKRICEDCEGKIFYNQKGAGSGKTWKSIQELHEKRFSDCKNAFQNKKSYVYVSKMHSACSVIEKEFKEQNTDKKLVISEEESIELDERRCDNNKKYMKLLTYPTDNNKTTVVISTIDSFIYNCISTRSENLTKTSPFEKNLNDVISGSIKNKISYFSSECKESTDEKQRDEKTFNIELDKSCIVFVDEAQDLGIKYFEALDSLRKIKGVDISFIGDRLQSIFEKENIMTHIYNMTKNKPEKYIKISPPDNTVRRFHNRKLMEFVNGFIQFENYDLPKIEKICERVCEYVHEDDDVIPFELEREDDEKNINTVLKYIIYENSKNTYLPEHYMIIFPILSVNIFATKLEERLKEYWMKTLTKEYIKQAFSKNKKSVFQSKYENLQDFEKCKDPFVEFHMSEEGQPINLASSNHRTRIQSIHSSKGTGREVVFFLNATEKNLSYLRCSSKGNDIRYESFLHIAVTRQKKKLYIGHGKGSDDIRHRLSKTHGLVLQTDIPIFFGLDYITKKLTKENFKKILDEEFSKKDLKVFMQQTLTDDKLNKKLIDFKHHEIRFITLKNKLFRHIDDGVEKKDEKRCQTFQVFKKLIQLESKFYSTFKEYNKNLKKEKMEYFPLLNISKKELVAEITQNFINDVRVKLEKFLNKENPIFCPIEEVILHFCMEIKRYGRYSTFPILKLYEIIETYRFRWSDTLEKEHNNYNCNCRVYFENKNENKFLAVENTPEPEHYEILKQIDKTIKKLKSDINTEYPDEKFMYNIDHTVNLNEKWGDGDDYEKREKGEHFFYTENFTIIGYSNGYVIPIIVRPTIDEVNITDIFFDIIMKLVCINSIKISNAKKSKKYNGKKVVFYIVSLDRLFPVKCDFSHIDVDVYGNAVKNCVKDKLFEYNCKIKNVYDETKAEHMEKLKEKILEEKIKDEYKKIMPKYIRTYMTSIFGSCRRRRELDKNILDEDVVDMLEDEFEK